MVNACTYRHPTAWLAQLNYQSNLFEHKAMDQTLTCCCTRAAKCVLRAQDREVASSVSADPDRYEVIGAVVLQPFSIPEVSLPAKSGA
mmetsp:Transcript_2927/g.7297  ORF Transcript_2927/g.7297 Transcript_2927/m.7297 type:complete len:88 (+) Transcript_2927:64-327(+)